MKKLINIIVILNFTAFVNAQQRISIDELINTAIENNFQNTVNDAQIKKAELDKKGAVEIPKTELFVENEDFQPSNPEGIWKIGLQQEIPWPGLNKARKNYMDKLILVHKMNRLAIEAEIIRDVKKSYYELWYLQQKKNLFQQLDSIYLNEFNAATIRYNTGDVAGLDKIAADVKLKENKAKLNQLEKEIEITQRQLMLLTNSQIFYLPEDKPLSKLIYNESLSTEIHPYLMVQQQEVEATKALAEVQKQQNHPDFSIRAFSQKYIGLKDPVSGFSLGVAFPLFGLKPMRARIEATEAEAEVQQTQLDWQQQNLNSQQEQALKEVEKEIIMLNFYEGSGLEQAQAIIAAASLSYKSGEISFAELSEFLIQAIGIKQNYLESLNLYNQSVIEYNYLTNQN